MCQQYLLCVHWKYVSPATPVTILRKGGESLEHPIPGRRLPGCVPLYIKSIPSQTEAALLGFLLLHKDETPFDTFCFCCLLWGNVFHTNLAHGWNDVGSQKYGVKQHHWLFPKFFFFFLRKSWKVRRVENINNCCRSCGKKGEILWRNTFRKFQKICFTWFCVKVRQGISLTLLPSTTSRENAPVSASPVIPRFGTFEWLEYQPANSGKAGKNDQKKGFPGWKVFERGKTNQHWTSINFPTIDFFLTATS